MPVNFDVTSDETFLRSLNELGEDIADAVAQDLMQVAAPMSWDEFCSRYKWEVHVRDPVDTYPGAVEYYKFIVPLPDSPVRIYCIYFIVGEVICAVAAFAQSAKA